MTFVGDADGGDEHSHHAPEGASSNWVSVPHGAKASVPGEVLRSRRTNRRWEPQEKAKITAESFEPGANVSAVARRMG
ncbi:hypothetical protein NOVOSPHI9U_190005 [Novosphingobium sp. 9U]|nr:hypothetical protein NOVOSPHI9U_190005 [Novosphingobium sp. 9U]